MINNFDNIWIADLRFDVFLVIIDCLIILNFVKNIYIVDFSLLVDEKSDGFKFLAFVFQIVVVKVYLVALRICLIVLGIFENFYALN